MTDYTNISARAMLVSLHVSVWSAQRFDRAVSDEVTASKHADPHSGRFNKHLFGTRRAGRMIAPEFTAVHGAADALYDFHVAQTLPWGSKGERLLPTANYVVYTDGTRRLGAALDRAAAAFTAAYPRLQAEAQARLGALYRDEDFPPADAVRQRFSYDVSFGPVPDSGDLRIDLPADQIAAIAQSVATRVEQATRDAMRDAWARLHEAVARIQRASGEDGIVRGTLIEHARETCAILARLNVVEDEQLEALRQQVECDLAGLTLDDLRTNAAVRTETARQAAAILDAMVPFMGA